MAARRLQYRFRRGGLSRRGLFLLGKKAQPTADMIMGAASTYMFRKHIVEVAIWLTEYWIEAINDDNKS